MKAYPTFYLSSTLEDLRPERQAVIEALEGAYAPLQSYHANERDLIESVLDDVAGASLYIGIVGLRYGFIPPGEDKSITELEYERAFEAGVPRFVFMKRPDKIYVTLADTDRTRINDFRQRVASGRPKEPRPAFFDETDDLKVVVLRTLFDWRNRLDSEPEADQAEWMVAARPTPPPPRCVGREAPLTSLVPMLTTAENRSAVLLGPQGIGKTTLALATLHAPAVVAGFGERRYFTRCEGLESRRSVAGAIASSMGRRVGRSVERTVLRELGEAPALVVLDSLESAWTGDTAAIEELLDLVVRTPRVALMVTMRGSDAPGAVDWSQILGLDPLDRLAAIDVFLAVARQVVPSDRRLRPLVDVLGRVPLAIVLMAYQAKGGVDLRTLSRRWRTERTAMLKRADARDALTSLDVSYQMAINDARVTADARRLLAPLALFARGIALEDLEGLAPSRSAGALAALRGAALASTEATRARVLSPLREYVRDTLVEPPDVERVVAYYSALVAQLAPQIGKQGGQAAAARLEREAANIEWALARGLQLTDRGAVIDAAVQWGKVARFSDAASASVVQHAARVAKADGDRARYAACLLAVGDVQLVRSTPDRAEQSYAQAERIFRDLGHERNATKCQYGLAMAHYYRGDAEAGANFAAAGETFKRLKEARWQANCLMGLADVYWLSDRAKARALFLEALTLYQRDADLLGQANCVRSIADLDLERSEYEAARRGYHEATILYERVGDLLGQGNCTFGLADVDRDRSPEAARLLYKQAQDVFRRLGHMRGEADCLYRLGDLARSARAIHEAEQHYVASQRLYRQLGWKLGIANATAGLARIAFAAGNDAQARSGFDEARILYAEWPEPTGEGECLLGRARLLARAGNLDAAQIDFALALDCLRKADDRSSIGLAHFLWASEGPETDRAAHRLAALEAWRSVDRPYLETVAASEGITADAIAELLAEHGGDA